MKNSIFYTEDFINVHLFHMVYWRTFYFFYFFYNPFYFFTMRFIFTNFFKYFWFVKLFHIAFSVDFSYFSTFQLELDNSIFDYNSNLDFSSFFCIELININYPNYFKKLNTDSTKISFKNFSLLFEIPLYVDFYYFEKKEKNAIKMIFDKKSMKIRRLHYFDKLTRSLKRGLIK